MQAILPKNTDTIEYGLEGKIERNNNVPSDYIKYKDIIDTFVCISKNERVVKILKVFTTYEEAYNYAKYMYSIDSEINIYVQKSGRWLPFDTQILESESNDAFTTYKMAVNNRKRKLEEINEE